MLLLKTLPLGLLAISQSTIAHPLGVSPTFLNTTESSYNTALEARKLYSLDAGHRTRLGKRALFNIDGIENDARKDALQQALKDAIEVASVVVDKMDKDKHKPKFEAWFGQPDDEPLGSYYNHVRAVFQNAVGDNHDHEGSDVLGQLTVFPDDYWVDKSTNVAFCSVVKDGKTGTAYYKLKDKKYFGMHYCDKFFTRKNAKEYKDQYFDDHCAAMPGQIDTMHIGRVFQGANVLHELMHYPLVGPTATGKTLGDTTYGAYNCYTLKSNTKALKGEKGDMTLRTIDNADSYVYYAMHIYLEEKCDREFAYPQSNADN